MKKLSLITSLILFTSFASIAQNSWIGATGGLNFPSGAFTNQNKYGIGRAAQGYNFQLQYGYSFNEHIAITVNPFMQWFDISKSDLINDINNSSNPIANYRLDSYKEYFIKGISIGLQYTISKDIPFFISANLGYITMSSPELNLYEQVNDYNVSIESKDASAFYYNFGIGYTHKVNNLLGLTAGLDYLGSTDLSFTGVRFTAFKGTTSIVNVFNNTEHFSALALKIGARFSF